MSLVVLILFEEINIETDYILWIPNAFTPNGDGLDEIFVPKGIGVVVFNMIVFPDGEKKFFSKRFKQWMGWDAKWFRAWPQQVSIPIG